MKYMTMRKKAYNLQLFAGEGEPDGTEAGGGDHDDDESDEDAEEDESEEKQFSQKELDEAVKKHIARERRKWQREQQKKPGDKPDSGDKAGEGAGETEAEKKARKAEEKAAALEMKWTCLEHDVKKDCVDDVLALAKAHMGKDEDMDVEDAIEAVLKKYPQFKDGFDETGDNDGQDKKGWGQRHGKPPKDQATVDNEIRKQLFGK